MNVVETFEFDVREIENCWIQLKDGVRLAARIWIPENAIAAATSPGPVPAVLEYVPYRKNDATSIGDRTRHYYLAGHGYAALRVDIRGSGESEGLLQDEYHAQEFSDCVEVINWIANQPWCDGQVAMMGISWGGFNALQVAALNPRPLKTIVTLCSTDDRYSDDVHYIGGSVLASEMLPWGTTMLALNARPPDPQYVGDLWRQQWLQRLHANPHFAEMWLEHQHRDKYWQHGSICEDYAAIQCPVLIAGGWADGYTDGIMRMLGGLSAPRKAIVGPWAHNWPNEAVPGPAIGFLQEVVRWFDHWLKGAPNGVMDEPMLTVWRQDWHQPANYYSERPGQWQTVQNWPSSNNDVKSYFLNRQGLSAKAAEVDQLTITPGFNHGQSAGVWCPFGVPGDFPSDQSTEDLNSLVFDTAQLVDSIDLIGQPRVKLLLRSDQPVAQLIIRLCDVAEDGSSLLLSRGVLNLTHRNSHEQPSPMPVGSWISVSIKLNTLAVRVMSGHRIRLSLAASYWPLVWPSPVKVKLDVKTGRDSILSLPVINGEFLQKDGKGKVPEKIPEREPEKVPEAASRPQYQILSRPSMFRETTTDTESSETRNLSRSLSPRVTYSNGMETFSESEDESIISEQSPHLPLVRSRRRYEMKRGDWDIRIEVTAEMQCSETRFSVKSSLRAFEGGVEVFQRDYHGDILRRLV